MPQRLVFSSSVHLPERLFAAFAPLVAAEPFTGHAAGLSPGDVLVVTPDEARPVLAGASPATLVLWRDQGEVDAAILTDARVAGVLDAGSAPDAGFAVLRAALGLAAAVGQRSATKMLHEVLQIGRALAVEKDLNTLLGLILTNARKLTHADGASIYTMEDAALRFRVWQNSSTTVDVSDKRILVGEDSIAGFVGRTGAPLVIADAYDIPPDAPYRFNPAYDRDTHYRTRSLLTVPLKNKADEVVGVLQLINRKIDPDTLLKEPADFARNVVPFDEQDEAIALALAGQAGVAIENSLLYADIERLFEGFITASVQAIESRDPVTAGHSSRVADFTERLAKAVDRDDSQHLRSVRFARDELRELRYAALLHDFGKVGVKENVLLKSKKLYPLRLELIEQRFKHARSSLHKEAYRRLLDLQEQRTLGAAELARERQAIERRIAEEAARLDRYWNVVIRANEPSVMPADVSAELVAVADYRVHDEQEQDEIALLLPFEFTDLSLTRGNLGPEERAQIESHVSHTYSFLSLIPWTRDLRRLPDIAFAHHEKLDGTGYPRRLAGDDIPVQSRMMTIADIYDALTARDRPYKEAVPAERALDILREEARRNKLDGRLLDVFVDAGAWRLDG